MKHNSKIVAFYEALTRKVDISLMNYLCRNISPDMNKLERAVAIYLLLGDVLCYSPSYLLSASKEEMLRASEISLEQNEVICKNWSYLYARILSKFGISAKVIEDGTHYYVEFMINGIIYEADATIYGSLAEHYSMSDLSNIKCGFRIEKIKIASLGNRDKSLEYKYLRELRESIERVYEIQDRKYIKREKVNYLICKVMDTIESHTKEVKLHSKEDILYRVGIINRFWKLYSKAENVERMQLFNRFYTCAFEDYEECERRAVNLFSFKDGEVKVNKLLCIGVRGSYYYFIEDGKEFKEYTREDILRMLNNREYCVHNYTVIMGFDDDCLDNFRYKKILK